MCLSCTLAPHQRTSVCASSDCTRHLPPSLLEMVVVGLAFCCTASALEADGNSPPESFAVQTPGGSADSLLAHDRLGSLVCRAGHRWTFPGRIRGPPARHLLGVPAVVRLRAPRRGQRQHRHPHRRRSGECHPCERRSEHRTPVHVSRAPAGDHCRGCQVAGGRGLRAIPLPPLHSIRRPRSGYLLWCSATQWPLPMHQLFICSIRSWCHKRRGIAPTAGRGFQYEA